MPRHCEYEWEDDPARQCKAYALLDSDPPRCRVHSLTPEERSRHGRSMAQAQALQRRAESEARPRSDLLPGIKLGEVLAVIGGALEAEDKWTAEPLWNVRLAAAGTLLAAFPRYYRETPEKVGQLLRELLPEHVFDSSQYTASKVYEAMQASWLSLDGLRWSEIHGLYTKAFPSWVVQPWFSDREKDALQRSRPAAVSSDRAPVKRALSGQVFLEREGASPLLLPAEEPDHEDILVDAGAVPAW